MHPWLRLICQVTLVAYVYVCMYESMYNNREREELIEKIKKVVTGWDEVEEERNVAWILDLACRNESIARGVEKLWAARFVQK